MLLLLLDGVYRGQGLSPENLERRHSMMSDRPLKHSSRAGSTIAVDVTQDIVYICNIFGLISSKQDRPRQLFAHLHVKSLHSEDVNSSKRKSGRRPALCNAHHNTAM